MKRKKTAKVMRTDHDAHGGIRRRRRCRACQARYSTYGHVVTVTPVLIKCDGGVGRFDRDKLVDGLRWACDKRPVTPDAIVRLADTTEQALQRPGCAARPRRTVGDRVIERLKALDDIAYIRYAIMHLDGDRLDGVPSAVDRRLISRMLPQQN